MKKLLTVILLLLSLSSGAQHTLYNLKFTLSQTNFVDTIPIEYERGRITMPVSINGNTYRFLFDTGASQTTIFDDVAIDGLKSAGTTVSHDAIGARTTVRKAALPPMTLGSTVFTGCQAIVQHRIVRGRSDIDGIIGFDIVCKGLNVKIDLRNRQLILSDLFDYFEKEPGITMKYWLDLHVPYVEVCPFGKYRERVLFDTGSRQLYVMNKNSFESGAWKAKENISSQIEGRTIGRYAMGHGGVEPRGEVVFLLLNRLQFGTFSFNDLHTLTTQGGSHLGVKVLEYGAVIFNPKRRRLRFQPYDDLQNAVVESKRLEKAIVSDKGRPVVGLIREGCKPYEAGLREGDTIMMIDQKPIRTFADYLRFRPIIDHEHVFMVRSVDGKMKEVKTVWM